MSNYKYTPSASTVTDATVSDLRRRIMILVISSTLVVAAAFGVSFYFAFISSGSAIARQIPELSPVVDKLRSQLLMNTFGVVVVIIASLFFLNRVIINRVFSNIGRIGKEMHEIADGEFPERGGIDPENGFKDISSAYNMMLSSLRLKEADELKQLEECIQMNGSGRIDELQTALADFTDKKKAALKGKTDISKDPERVEKESGNGIFLQPS